MKCHYEILDIPRDADDTEIKTSYRKLALKWHPDKNLDNSEYAKEQFQLVQQAYEVLSDRQERAWYDKHRDQILYGANSEFQDNSLDLFQYFTTCFKGYGDEEQGFYTVYRNVFEKIAQEDMDFMEGKDEFCEIPSFGNSNTEFEKVAEFYAYWSTYSTKKSYVWLDPFDIKEIRDRRYIKLVEKENKKIRQKAKKERNEEVRSLVAFIKKRDRRVQAQKKFQEQKLLEEKKKREQLSKQKRLERQKLNESDVQPDWAKFDNVKSELEEIEKSLAEEFGEELSNSEDEDEDENLSNLYCAACNKVFKTPKAFQNHESSKKHKENIENLKSLLLEDELERESNVSDNTDDYIEVGNEQTSDVDEQIANLVNQDTASNSEEIDVDDIEEIRIKTKRKKKPKNIMVVDEEITHDNLQISSSEDDFNFEKNKKQKKRSKKSTSKMQSKQINYNCDNEINVEVNVEKEVIKQKKNSKEKKVIKEKLLNEVGDIDINHNCVACKSTFPSKNKLFDHLKKTGHGVYIPANVKNKRKKDIKEK